ncbi:glyoxalase [Staphylococcus succinus]|uniref:VOC family protein n=1 Tax=Staphylococcus succinus TaxID=61015 RepID=UPI000D1DFA8F|nr:VOC family protein [Staphylococcus succinus]PTJ81583.1 glyoxalase [Staphylococcus succinus]
MTFHDNASTHVTNITLNVADLSTMRIFYKQILGLTIRYENKTSIVFNIGKNSHTLTLNEIIDARRPSMREAGLFHIAILLPTRADLGNFLYHASSMGIQVSGGDHLVSEALYFADPEGNGIEVYYDRPKSTWAWDNSKVKMDTLAVDVNDLVAQRTETGWDSMPDNAKIGHLHLKVADLAQAKQFYMGQLGLQHISDFPQALFMSTNNYHHHIATNTWQSDTVRIDNSNSLGLTHVDIYKPESEKLQLLSPEGFSVTIHSDTSCVADKN